jgi:hypothetical protein
MKNLINILLCLALCVAAYSQTAFRPPAVPLIANDPYFSIWSFQDRLTDDMTRHWTGTTQGFCSLIRIDGQTRRLMGPTPREIAALSQVAIQVMPTQSIYELAGDGIKVILTFTSPLLPDDIGILSKPVTFLTYQVCSTDGKEHEVQLYFDSSMELTVNDRRQKVVWSRLQTEELAVLCAGTQEQPLLEKAGDNLRIDWGYFYLAAELGQKPTSVIQKPAISRDTFIKFGRLPYSDDLAMPRAVKDDGAVLAMQFSLGRISSVIRQRYLILAYDDQFAIEYFQRKLRPYWRKDGAEAADLLDSACKGYAGWMNRCAAFDRDLYADLRAAGGEEYARLASLAFRQALAAQKLAADADGKALLFPKENFSNGCIATVDVIYPAAPQLLLFNIELMKASLRPVLEYACMPRWKFPFAPHDLGTYPQANGQVYGGAELTEENQMPVEESGNMLLLLAAVAKVEGHANFATLYWPAVQKWAIYLQEKGLDPENQLCTDDFAGHLAHNVNLSLKAILALGAFSQLCEWRGMKAEALTFRKLAEAFAQKWMAMADDGDHYRLAFDKPQSWSQKYNLVWDRILNLNLFPAEVAQKEIRYYLQKQNKYGLPLDNRKDYTKLDWTVWTATLAESAADFQAIVKPVFQFAHESPSRVPLSDWYGTIDAKMVGFQARSVVGGVFIKMLADSLLWSKWVKR